MPVLFRTKRNKTPKPAWASTAALLGSPRLESEKHCSPMAANTWRGRGKQWEQLHGIPPAVCSLHLDKNQREEKGNLDQHTMRFRVQRLFLPEFQLQSKNTTNQQNHIKKNPSPARWQVHRNWAHSHCLRTCFCPCTWWTPCRALQGPLKPQQQGDRAPIPIPASPWETSPLVPQRDIRTAQYPCFNLINWPLILREAEKQH